jgi:hypothetical protein
MYLQGYLTADEAMLPTGTIIVNPPVYDMWPRTMCLCRDLLEQSSARRRLDGGLKVITAVDLTSSPGGEIARAQIEQSARQQRATTPRSGADAKTAEIIAMVAHRLFRCSIDAR